MQRSTFLNSLFAIAAAVPASSRAATAAKRIAGIGVPDTALATEALAIAKAAEPAAILNYSLRTYLFAELIAKAKRIDHDSEVVYVASILHDTGSSAKYMSAANPFEVDGADVACTLLAHHDVAGDSANLVWDAIALHDNGGITRHKQPEVMLMNAGVGADFGGSLDLLRRSDIVAVLDAAPRAHFTDVFLGRRRRGRETQAARVGALVRGRRRLLQNSGRSSALPLRRDPDGSVRSVRRLSGAMKKGPTDACPFSGRLVEAVQRIRSVVHEIHAVVWTRHKSE